MTTDQRFALMAKNGDVLFPYIKKEKSGREGFAISAPGKRDANGEGEYVLDLAVVIRRLVFDGWKVRAKKLTTSHDPVPREGSFGLQLNAIGGYWLAPELMYLVAGASIQPLAREDLRLNSKVEKLTAADPSSDEEESNHNTSTMDTLAFKAASDLVNADPDCQELSPTSRQALINARIGQGGYRKRMMALWGDRCAVSGCAVPAVLIASHAVAWAECQNDNERLDEHNCLLLAASIDRLFDCGQISFDDRGQILVAAQLSDEDLLAIGMNRGTRLRFVPPSLVLGYLKRHRVQHGFQA